MKATSAQAWEDICNDGTLTAERRAVLRVVGDFARKGLTVTGHELDVHLTSPDAHKRLSELARQKAIYIKERRPCRITGRMAEAYEPTGNKAVALAQVAKPTKAPTKKQRRSAGFDLQDLIDQEELAGRAVSSELKLLAGWLLA